MNDIYFYIIGILILIVIGVAIYFRIKYMKSFQVPCVTLFTGAPKTGKTLCSVNCALRLHRKKRIIYFIKKYILSLVFKKFKNIEKPLLYSNIKLKVRYGYVLITKDLLLRQKRFNYGSTILISECSLVADSMNYKDRDTNDILTIFNKLIGHETKGGHLIYDTQSLFDCHYSIKRVCSSYYYIVKSFPLNRIVPFFHFVKLKKMEYNADLEQVVQNVDTEDTGYWYALPKATYKKYDRYCYSIFTDDLIVSNNVDKIKGNNLKTDSILMLRDILNAERKLKKESDLNDK